MKATSNILGWGIRKAVLAVLVSKLAEDPSSLTISVANWVVTTTWVKHIRQVPDLCDAIHTETLVDEHTCDKVVFSL